MKKFFLTTALIAYAIIIYSCITPFQPEGVTDIDNMVVVEGDIILNDTTRVIISRSQAIKDQSKVNYITKAQAWVVSDNGTLYQGKEVLRKGKTQYIINTIGLDPARQYKLRVRLLGGQLYESDLLPVLVSPLIDSIGVTSDYVNKTATFYVNTHDSQNNTRYYKWSFIEDWEFHSQYLSMFLYDPVKDKINNIDFNQNRYYCWNSRTSSAILVASTANLEQDVVFQKFLVSMGPEDKRISYLYSMHLTQMAISHEAFIYWENISKNSDKIGGIFAPQPTEIGGNIKCLSNPAERVLGYISAGIVSRKRTFNYATDIGIYKEPALCESVFIDGTNPIPFISMYESGYDVISYSQEASESYWVQKICSDCRVFGTKIKPSFWPNNHI
ncbi:MAG: hypothetical protein A2X18_00100 [Bacteroidetes bacterium GWF2_40_14]|nr:MAG: hypothetical protein A2X18_00100 [Bacteroidetes bacterium GWF2_40_14]